MIPLINRGRSGSSEFDTLMTSVRNAITRVAPGLPGKEQVSKMGVSLESYGADDVKLFEDAGAALTKEFSTISQEAFRLEDQKDAKSSTQGGLEWTSLENKAWMAESQSRAATEAAAILATAHKSPAAYMAIEPREFDSNTRLNQMVTSGPAGTIGLFNGKPSLESFDETETEKWKEFSYAVNLMAAKMHPFAELFYKLFLTTPENAGFLLSIRRTLVWEGYKQTDLNGNAVAVERTNALIGLLDHRLLETASTRLYPCITDENEAWFVPEAVFPYKTITQGSDKFETSLIKFDSDEMFNLINLAWTPSRIAKGGVPNWTDALDRRIAIDTLGLTVTDGDTTESFLVYTDRDTNAQFLAPREYNFRDMHVKFQPELRIGNEVLNTDKLPLGPLKALYDLGVAPIIQLKIDGEVNVESSNGQVRLSGQPKITGLYQLVGDANAPVAEVDMADPKYADALKDIVFKAVGWYPESRLNNLNQLDLGKLVDSQVQKEGFIIPTLSPLALVKPTGMEDDKVYPKVEALQFIYRTQLRNDAVTSLLNRADTLKKYLGNKVLHEIETNLNIEGLSQYYHRSYFEEEDIDVLHDLNNITSSCKMSDINALMLGRINETIYRVNAMTGYSSVLEREFPGSSPKPHVAIGTDLYLPQFLMIPGDDRTVGIGFDHTVASISDQRMRDKIIIQFTLPDQKGEPHPLDSGICGMIPEFMANWQMIRNQRIATEIRLTPRYRYFNFTTLMIVFNVKNLKEAIQTRIQLDVNSKDVTEFPGK